MKNMFKFIFVILCFCSIFSRTAICANYSAQISESLEKWDIDGAKKIAEGLMAKDPANPEVAFLTGKVYFYMGDYFRASDYLEKAVKEKNRPDWFEYYAFVKKAGEIMGGALKKETKHFEIRYFGEDDVLARYLENNIEKICGTVATEMSFVPDTKVIVEIFPTLEGFNHNSSLTKKDIETSGAIGIAKFNRVMVLSPRNLAFGYRWTDTIAHEFTHYIIARASRGVFPLWMHEGIAFCSGKGATKRDVTSKYNGREWDRSLEPGVGMLSLYQKDRLVRALILQNTISFAKMEPSMVKLANQDEVSLAFSEVACAIDYLIKKNGRDKLISFIKLCGELKDYRKAFKKTYSKTLEDFEMDWLAWLSSLKIEPETGLTPDSIKLKDAKETSPEDSLLSAGVRGYISLADEFFSGSKLPVAEIQYKKALEISPKNPVILNRLGRVLLGQEKYQEAIDILEKAAKYNPDYANTYVNLADCYVPLNKIDDALVCLSESNEINPFNPYIHRMMGLIYYNRNDRANAIFEWKNVLKLDPDNAQIKTWLSGLGVDVK